MISERSLSKPNSRALPIVAETVAAECRFLKREISIFIQLIGKAVYGDLMTLLMHVG